MSLPALVLMPQAYGTGLEIWLVPFSVTAALDSTRPGSNVVLACITAPAAQGEHMMVPRNVLVAPIETPEAAPDDTQYTLLLAAFAVPPNFTVIVGAEVNAPPAPMEASKMYTPGLVRVRREPTDIAPVTQWWPATSGWGWMAKSIAPAG